MNKENFVFGTIFLFALIAFLTIVSSSTVSADCEGTRPAAANGTGCTPGTTYCWTAGGQHCTTSCQGNDGGTGTWGAAVACATGRSCSSIGSGGRCVKALTPEELEEIASPKISIFGHIAR